MCNKSQGFYGLNSTLSPAAQSVLNEVLYKMCAGESESYAQMIAAAALRAAADQLPLSRGWDTGVYWSVRHLLAIAAELEGAE
jgi:hypothetical protein